MFFFFSFWLIFYPLDPDPWIRIFLRIQIQEGKILRIQRIRILSTGPKKCTMNIINSKPPQPSPRLFLDSLGFRVNFWRKKDFQTGREMIFLENTHPGVSFFDARYFRKE